MKHLFIILIVNIFFMARCHKKDVNPIQTNSDGVVVSVPYQWKKSLHNEKPFNSNGYIKDAIYYNGNIAIPTTNGENNRLGLSV